MSLSSVQSDHVEVSFKKVRFSTDSVSLEKLQSVLKCQKQGIQNTTVTGTEQNVQNVVKADVEVDTTNPMERGGEYADVDIDEKTKGVEAVVSAKLTEGDTQVDDNIDCEQDVSGVNKDNETQVQRWCVSNKEIERSKEEKVKQVGKEKTENLTILGASVEGETPRKKKVDEKEDHNSGGSSEEEELRIGKGQNISDVKTELVSPTAKEECMDKSKTNKKRKSDTDTAINLKKKRIGKLTGVPITEGNKYLFWIYLLEKIVDEHSKQENFNPVHNGYEAQSVHRFLLTVFVDDVESFGGEEKKNSFTETVQTELCSLLTNSSKDAKNLKKKVLSSNLGQQYDVAVLVRVVKAPIFRDFRIWLFSEGYLRVLQPFSFVDEKGLLKRCGAQMRYEKADEMIIRLLYKQWMPNVKSFSLRGFVVEERKTFDVVKQELVSVRTIDSGVYKFGFFNTVGDEVVEYPTKKTAKVAVSVRVLSKEVVFKVTVTVMVLESSEISVPLDLK